MCRKIFASQASAYALLEPDEFSWFTGESKLSKYAATKDQAILFCSKCDSALGGTFNDKVTCVTLGCVDGDLQIEFEMHIFAGSKTVCELRDSFRNFRLDRMSLVEHTNKLYPLVKGRTLEDMLKNFTECDEEQEHAAL